jgi:hypothetical protein
MIHRSAQQFRALDEPSRQRAAPFLRARLLQRRAERGKPAFQLVHFDS